MLAKMETTEGLDNLGQVVPLVKQGLLAVLVPEDSRVCQDLQERMDPQARMVDLDCRELWA